MLKKLFEKVQCRNSDVPPAVVTEKLQQAFPECLIRDKSSRSRFNISIKKGIFRWQIQRIKDRIVVDKTRPYGSKSSLLGPLISFTMSVTHHCS